MGKFYGQIKLYILVLIKGNISNVYFFQNVHLTIRNQAQP